MKIHLYILYLFLVIILIELFYKCSCFNIKERFDVNTTLKPNKTIDSSKYLLKTTLKSNKKKKCDNKKSSDYILKTEMKANKLKIPTKYILKTNIKTNTSKNFDKTKYILKNEIKPTDDIDLSKYKLKTSINSDKNNIDMTKYILKTQIPSIDMSKYMLRTQPRSYNPSTVGVYKNDNTNLKNIIESENTTIQSETEENVPISSNLNNTVSNNSIYTDTNTTSYSPSHSSSNSTSNSGKGITSQRQSYNSSSNISNKLSYNKDEIPIKNYNTRKSHINNLSDNDWYKHQLNTIHTKQDNNVSDNYKFQNSFKKNVNKSLKCHNINKLPDRKINNQYFKYGIYNPY